MFIMFMDREGIILSHAVPSGQTVNADYYSKVKQMIIFNCHQFNCRQSSFKKILWKLINIK